MDAINDRMFVSVSYQLYVGGDDGTKEEIMEEAPASAPFKFTCGLGMVLNKFENELKGKSVGDKFDFYIDKEDAYGEYSDKLVVDVDKKIFEQDGEIDTEVIYEGNVVPMMDAEGHRMNGVICEIGDTKVKMDFNHPLAGERLHFVGSVLEVRPATEEEIAVVKKPCGGCHGGGCHSGSGDCNGDCKGCHGEGESDCHGCK